MKSLDKNFICPHCEHQFYSEWVSVDELDWHVSCPECGGPQDTNIITRSAGAADRTTAATPS